MMPLTVKGGQLKVLAHIVVAQVMEFELAKELVLPAHLADSVASRIRPLQGLMQQLAGVWVGIELDFGRQFHGAYLTLPSAISAKSSLIANSTSS